MAVLPADAIPGVALRASTQADQPFVAALFATTRETERANFQGDESLWSMLMEQQARLQEHHYRTHYDGATIDIMERDGQPIGRLCLCEFDDEIRLMDIALLPEVRNGGLGTRVIRTVMDAAAERGKAVRIHVEQFNPAWRLYKRLGFKFLEDRGIYQFMEWRPKAESSPANGRAAGSAP